MQAIEPSPRDPSRAWESAFATHYCGLCDYVLRFVGSADAAQDLVQDLFLHLWDTRGPRDAVRLTRGYLYVAARNRALKYLRHRRVADAWADRAAREEPPLPPERARRIGTCRASWTAPCSMPSPACPSGAGRSSCSAATSTTATRRSRRRFTCRWAP